MDLRYWLRHWATGHENGVLGSFFREMGRDTAPLVTTIMGSCQAHLQLDYYGKGDSTHMIQFERTTEKRNFL